MSEPIIVITGATACGKSAVAVRLAERIGGEIISADSMQVYRGMDVGTGKPDDEWRRRVPHHLIDVVDPWEGFSAQRFVEAAEPVIVALRRRRLVPLVVGGTVLYIRALTEGLFDGPSADWALRNALMAEAEHRGTPHLHQRLAAVDPAAAAAIHANDLRRIVRALEVHEKTGRPISEHQRQFDRPDVKERRRLLVLDRDREDLYERIDRRVDRMMAAGWLDEMRRLLADPRGWSREASQALGYRELGEHLAERLSLEEAVELIKRHTRQFAKRQLAWFRRLADAVWIPVASGDTDEVLAQRVEASGHFGARDR